MMHVEPSASTRFLLPKFDGRAGSASGQGLPVRQATFGCNPPEPDLSSLGPTVGPARQTRMGQQRVVGFLQARVGDREAGELPAEAPAKGLELQRADVAQARLVLVLDLDLDAGR